MAFNLFNLFKRKSKKQEEQEKSIEKMTFGELLKKADSIHKLKFDADSKDDSLKEIDDELMRVLILIKKAITDPENAEAQKYVAQIEQEYINSQEHLKRIEKRETEISSIEKRYSTLRGRKILEKTDRFEPLSEDEEKELEKLKATEVERRSEKTHLIMLKHKESSNITLLKFRMSRYGIRSEKIKEYDAALERERIEALKKEYDERAKRMVERDERRKLGRKQKQPGEDDE